MLEDNDIVQDVA